VREFGHYQKQSSFWSNNKACLTQIEGNIVFNGPRAGINFNGKSLCQSGSPPSNDFYTLRL
jgi:hypothetical protein